MKKSEVLAFLEKGGIYMIGEYRSSKVDEVKYRDKVTGKGAKFASHLHVVETGDTTVTVQDRVEEGVDVATLKPLFAKGTKVLVRVDSLERVQGFHRATGAMSPIEA